jgi:Pterin binding enzyme
MLRAEALSSDTWPVCSCRCIASRPGFVVSADTFSSEVARAAVDAGAHIINDVTGGRADADMLSTVRFRHPEMAIGMRACVLHPKVALRHRSGTDDSAVGLC